GREWTLHSCIRSIRPTPRRAPGLRGGVATVIAGRSGKTAPAAEMKMNMRTSGFTLIELMIALSIFAFLLFLAGPMYADFMGNSQIRNAAENTLSGVRLAQATAIKGNSVAEFILSTTGWAVYAWDDELADFAL